MEKRRATGIGKRRHPESRGSKSGGAHHGASKPRNGEATEAKSFPPPPQDTHFPVDHRAEGRRQRTVKHECRQGHAQMAFAMLATPCSCRSFFSFQDASFAARAVNSSSRRTSE
eukprot:3401980-Pyramimonas_sp.AAC.1